MSARTLLLVLFVLALARLPSVAQEGGDVASSEGLVLTVKKAMEEYLRTATRLCGTVRERSGSVEDGTLWVDATTRIKQNGNYGYLVQNRQDYGLPQRHWRALLYGPTVRAHLKKTAEGTWYVDAYRGGGRPVREACWILTYYTACGYFVQPGFDWQFACLWWSDAVSIESVEWEETQGKKLVKVTFSSDNSLQHRTGVAWLDPEWSWAIVRKEDRRVGQSGRPHVLTITYDEAFRPAPVPKLMEIRWPGSGEKPGGWWRGEFDFHIPDEPPKDEEFTLATFGIDPLKVSDQPAKRATWLWLGLLASLLAAILWWARQRLQQKTNVANEQ